MTDDIVAFLRERLDEVEAHARKDLHLIEKATPPEQWTAQYGYNLPFSLLGEGGSIARVTSSYGRPLADGEPDRHQADAMLAARLARRSKRQAERALRDVEAKRQLLEVAIEMAGADRAGIMDPPWIFRVLALSYSDHPSYRQEWA